MSLADLAVQLARARAQASPLDAAPWLKAVTSVADAYQVQSQLSKLAGDDVRGWKVSALKPEQQRAYATDKPVAGPLFGAFVHAAPATLSAAAFVAPLLECEVAFLLGMDLPPRPQPYAHEEIAAAIEAVIPVIEIADCRWPADAPDLLKLADAMGNGAFITGRPLRDWRKLDLTNLAVALTRDGNEIERGSSARILGNPLLAVEALANAQPLPAGGLKRGQIVTTGTCTTPVPPVPGQYLADCAALGGLGLTMVA